MSIIVLACIAGGWVLSRPIVRAIARRSEPRVVGRILVRRSDYLRTRSNRRGPFSLG